MDNKGSCLRTFRKDRDCLCTCRRLQVLATVYHRIAELTVHSALRSQRTTHDPKEVARSSWLRRQPSSIPIDLQCYCAFPAVVLLLASLAIVVPSQAVETGLNVNSTVAPVRPESPPPAENNRMERLPPPKLSSAVDLTIEVCSLDDVMQMALCRNPTIETARARVEASKGNWQQVGLKPNPQVGYSAQEVGLEGRAGQQGLVIQRDFVRGGKLALNRAVAEHEIELAMNELCIAEQRVRNNVRWAYFEALILQQRLEKAREVAQLAKDNMAAIDQLRQAQEISQITVYQGRVDYESALFRVQQASVDLNGAMRRLASIVGVPELGCGSLLGDPRQQLPDLEWQPIMDRFLGFAPQLQSAQIRINQAQARLARARAGRVPNVSVQGGVFYADAEEQPFANLSIIRPLQIHNRNQGNIRRAEAEVIETGCALEATRRALLRQLATRYRDYQQATIKVESYYDRVLPASESKLALVREGFRQGEVDSLTLSMSQREYAILQLGAIGALQVAWQAAVELEGFLLLDADDEFDLSIVGF